MVDVRVDVIDILTVFIELVQDITPYTNHCASYGYSMSFIPGTVWESLLLIHNDHVFLNVYV